MCQARGALGTPMPHRPHPSPLDGLAAAESRICWQEGHFPEAVERRFADAIKHLEAASWGSEEAKVWKSRHPPLQVGEAFVKASGHDAANGVQASEKTGVRLEQTWSHCDLFLMTVVAEL